jgi:hypothetical protein
MLVVEDHEIGPARGDNAGKAGGIELTNIGTDHELAGFEPLLDLVDVHRSSYPR